MTPAPRLLHQPRLYGDLYMRRRPPVPLRRRARELAPHARRKQLEDVLRELVVAGGREVQVVVPDVAAADGEERLQVQQHGPRGGARRGRGLGGLVAVSGRRCRAAVAAAAAAASAMTAIEASGTAAVAAAVQPRPPPPQPVVELVVRLHPRRRQLRVERRQRHRQQPRARRRHRHVHGRERLEHGGGRRARADVVGAAQHQDVVVGLLVLRGFRQGLEEAVLFGVGGWVGPEGGAGGWGRRARSWGWWCCTAALLLVAAPPTLPNNPTHPKTQPRNLQQRRESKQQTPPTHPPTRIMGTTRSPDRPSSCSTRWQPGGSASRSSWRRRVA